MVLRASYFFRKKFLVLITFSLFAVSSAAGDTYQFNNCGASGAYGPSGSCGYPGDNSLNNIIGDGIQVWEVPATGTYEIRAWGGGGGGPSTGGYAKGQIDLSQGDQLRIISGQKGRNIEDGRGDRAWGGGGGSFVMEEVSSGDNMFDGQNVDLLVAAGGGGGGDGYGTTHDGRATTSGGAADTQTNADYRDGEGGTGGSEGSPNGDGYEEFAGAGYLGGAPAGSYCDASDTAVSILEGGLGGRDCGYSPAQGGFGGGGSAGNNNYGRAGGGGGYSGGGTATCQGCKVDYSGGGGGSYLGSAMSSTSKSAGVNSGHGYVEIESLTDPDNPVIQEPSFSTSQGDPSTISADADVNIDYDGGSTSDNELETCSVTATGEDGNSVSASTSISGDTCSFSVDSNDHSSWESGETIEFDIDVEDSYGGTDSIVRSEDFPNTKPDQPSNPEPFDSENSVSTSYNLYVDVSNPDGASMDVEFYLDDGSGFSYVATDTGVCSGCTASVNPSLSSGSSYDWYAVAKANGYSTQSPTWSFTTNYRPSVDSVSKTDSSDSHAFSSVSAVVSDSDGDDDISSAELTVTDGVSYNSYSPTSIDRSYGNSNEASVSFGEVWVGDGSNWGLSDSMQLEVTTTDSEGNTGSNSINRQFPNHNPEIASGYRYSDDPQNHAFTLEIDAEDVDNGGGEITQCSVSHSGPDSNSYSNNGNLNQGETATCSFTIDTSFSGYDRGDEISHQVTFTDAHGSEVTASSGSYKIPNTPPSASNLQPSGDEIGYGPTLNATYNDVDGDTGSLTFYNTSAYVSDNFNSFDQSDWSLSGTASYDSSNDRVQLNAGGGATSGSVELDRSVSESRWVSDFKFTNGADGADEAAFSFYADGMGADWTPSDGYQVSYDHWDDEIRLNSFSGGSFTTLKKNSMQIGSGTFDGKIAYDQGEVDVYFEGEKELEYTIGSPDYTYSGFYVSARDGGSSGDHYLERFALSQLSNQIGQVTGLAPGEQASVDWPEADATGTTYNFTVNASDGLNSTTTTENFTTIYKPKAPRNPDPDNESTVNTNDRSADPVAASVEVVHPDGRSMNVEFVNASNDVPLETDYDVGSGERAKITDLGNSLRDETNTTYRWYARAYDTGTGEVVNSSVFQFTTVEVGDVVFNVEQGEGDNMDITGESNNGYREIRFEISSTQMDPIPQVNLNRTSDSTGIKSWTDVDNNSVLTVDLVQDGDADWTGLSTDSEYEYFIEAYSGVDELGTSVNYTIHTFNTSQEWDRAERYYDVYQYDLYRAQDTGGDLYFDYGNADYDLVGSLPETEFKDAGPGLEPGRFCWRVAASNPSGSSDAIPLGDGKCETLN